MPMQVGQMMVVVRAQDFASRTLRRVSGELAGMSRQQMLARGMDISRMQSMRQLNALAKASAAQGGIKALQQELNIRKELEAHQASMARMQAAGGRTWGWTKQGRAAAAEAARLQGELTAIQGVTGKLSPDLKRLAGDEAALARAGQDAAVAQAGASISLRHNAEDMTRLSAAVKGLPIQKLHDLGHAMGGIGRTMQLTGAIGTAALGLASNAYANFQQKVTLAATQTRAAGQTFVATAVNANRLSNAILKMMQKFPASADDMASAAYDIYSSIDTTFGGGLKLLEMFNKVAVAGGVDLKTATQAGISVLENFDTTLAGTGKVTAQTNQILQRMFAIVRYGRMTFTQFNQMLASVIPAATGAQQSLDDISGAMAFLTRRIPSAQKAGTYLARLMEVFTNRDFQMGMKRANASILDYQNHLRPLPDIIERVYTLVAKRAGKAPELLSAKQLKFQLNDVIRVITAYGRAQGRGREFTAQARRALIQLISGFAEYRRVQGAVVGDNTEFTNSYKAMSQTLGIRWQIFLNQLKVLVLYVGQSALPVFVKIGEAIGEWIRKWENLSKHTRDMIIRWGAILSVGSLVAGVLLSIGGVLVGLVASILRVSKAFGGAGAGAGGGGLLGNLSGALTSLRGLKAIGTIAIGVRLIKMGGEWRDLGYLVTAAGIGYGLGGRRGAAAGGIIAINVVLRKKGGEWGSVLGNILSAAFAGYIMGGGPPGAVVGAGAAVTIELWTHFNPQGITEGEKAIERFQQFQKKVVGQQGWSINLQRLGLSEQQAVQVAGNAWKAFEKVNAKKGFDAGQQAAKNYIAGYVKKLIADPTWRKSAAAGIDPEVLTQIYSRILKHIGVQIDQLQPDKKMTLSEALKSAKSFTEIMNIANNQLNNAYSAADKLATAMARAFAKGQIEKANALLRKYIQMANQKVTLQNLGKLLTKAFAEGGPQAASQLLDQFVQNMQQATNDWEQYQKQLVQTQEQANADILSNLRSLYDQVYNANEQMMGQLFHGPWLTGEAMNLAKEWGISPGVQDIIKDINMATDQFKKRRAQIDILMKRGLPKGFLDELRQMTPEEAMPILDKLVKATPAETRKLIIALNRRGKEIKNASKLDFTREINSFKKAGVSMGEAIKNGFQSAEVGKWFDTWVKKTFPGVISAAVSQAVADWKKNNPQPEAPPKIPGATKGNKAGVAGGKTQGGNTTSTQTTTTHYNVTVESNGKNGQEQGRAAAFALRTGIGRHKR